jgi:nucleotide-binding universal stress UspA family protein
MYARILVATDGSRAADLAVTEAVELAKTQDATLRIAHVIDASNIGIDPEFVSRADFRNAKARAGREILAEAAAFARDAGLRVEIRLLEIERLDQRTVDVLAEEAKAWPADLVVIGSHGEHGPNRLHLGSVAEDLVRIAAEPVLLVRGAASE